MTLAPVELRNLIRAPFALAGGAGFAYWQGAPALAGLSIGCLLVFTAWVIDDWLATAKGSINSDTTPEPAAPMPALPGWTMVSAETASYVPPGRIMLTVANRMIPLKMTPEQARYLAARVTMGNRKISYDLYGRGKPFQRADVDRLRIDLPRRSLAEWQGSQVVLTEAAAEAIRNQYPALLRK